MVREGSEGGKKRLREARRGEEGKERGRVACIVHRFNLHQPPAACMLHSLYSPEEHEDLREGNSSVPSD